MINRLNDILVVSISFLFVRLNFFWFLVLILSQSYIVLNIIIRYNKSFKRGICCFDFCSHFLVSVSLLINIGKELCLPGCSSIEFLLTWAYRVIKSSIL